MWNSSWEATFNDVKSLAIPEPRSWLKEEEEEGRTVAEKERRAVKKTTIVSPSLIQNRRLNPKAREGQQAVHMTDLKTNGTDSTSGLSSDGVASWAHFETDRWLGGDEEPGKTEGKKHIGKSRTQLKFEPTTTTVTAKSSRNAHRAHASPPEGVEFSLSMLPSPTARAFLRSPLNKSSKDTKSKGVKDAPGARSQGPVSVDIGDTVVDLDYSSLTSGSSVNDYKKQAAEETKKETDPLPSKKRVLNILQSLRWFTAMHIICYHFLTETGNSRWDQFASWGATQLTFFFMLSGFILAYQYQDRPIKCRGKFLFKRWARLYPTYLLSIILQCVALPKIGIPVDAGALLATIFCLTTWLPRYFLNLINTPGWSVGAFLFQYTLFPTLHPVIAKAKQSTRFKKLLPACWIYSVLEAGHAMGIDISLFKPFNWVMLPPHTASFMFGIVLGCCFVHSEDEQHKDVGRAHKMPAFLRHFGLSLVIVATTLVFVFAPIEALPSFFYFWSSHGMFMPLMAFAIWLGALESDCLLRHWLSLKPFLLLGQVSFTIYILQGCVNTYTTYWIVPWLNNKFGLGLKREYALLVVVTVAGILVYFFFEQPAYNALLVLDRRNKRRGGLPATRSASGSKSSPTQTMPDARTSSRFCTLYTLFSNQWVRVLGYYVLMALSIGGYVALSLSSSFIDWTGLLSVRNDFVAELSVNIVKCCFFLAAPALLFGFVGHLLKPPARRVKVPSLQDGVEANRLKARLFFRIVTRGKNPSLVRGNVMKATKVLRNTALPDWQWKVEVATDNPLDLHNLNDPQVHELLTPSSYVCPNGGKYKARALHYAVGISVARDEDWVIHLDEESSFDQETVRYIYAHCAREEAAVESGKKLYGNIGQGVILYGCHDHPPNYLTTLADSIRVADDFGKFRVQYEVGEPLIGMHGSFVVCQTKVEAEVGFDHGIAGSITEDAYFALVARAAGVRFSWIDAFMYEQSPFNIIDFIRQRSRWFGGLLLVCLASAIPLKQRAVLCFMTLSWAITPLVTLASVTNYLVGTSWSASTPAYTIMTSVLAGISCWGYILGFVWTFSPKQGWIRYALLFYSQLILQPVFAIMEMSGVIHGIIFPPSKGFYIVQKQADGNFSNTTATATANNTTSNMATI